MIGGYEGASIVESIGEGVTRFKSGDRVILSVYYNSVSVESANIPKETYVLQISSYDVLKLLAECHHSQNTES